MEHDGGLSVDQAIADLVSRGYHAQKWSSPPGAMAVASEVYNCGDIPVLKHMVRLSPIGDRWLVSCVPVGETTRSSLSEAINLAAKLVSELRDLAATRVIGPNLAALGPFEMRGR